MSKGLRRSTRDFETEKALLMQGYKEAIQFYADSSSEIVSSDLSSGDKAARLKAIRDNISKLNEECASAYEEINTAQMEASGFLTDMPYGVEEGYVYNGNMMGENQNQLYGPEATFEVEGGKTMMEEYGTQESYLVEEDRDAGEGYAYEDDTELNNSARSYDAYS